MVAGLNVSPLVLEVHSALPVNNVPEFISYAKADPDRINLASFGTGSISHLAGELFKTAAGLDLLHVPYRGGGPMLLDLLAGHVKAAFDTLPASIEHIRAATRALAVTTAKRSEVLSHIPSLGEYLPGYEASAFLAIGAPKGTPVEIVNKLNQEINRALADPKVNGRLGELGSAPLLLSPDELGKLVDRETRKYAEVTRTAKIKAE